MSVSNTVSLKKSGLKFDSNVYDLVALLMLTKESYNLKELEKQPSWIFSEIKRVTLYLHTSTLFEALKNSFIEDQDRIIQEKQSSMPRDYFSGHALKIRSMDRVIFFIAQCNIAIAIQEDLKIRSKGKK